MTTQDAGFRGGTVRGHEHDLLNASPNAAGTGRFGHAWLALLCVGFLSALIYIAMPYNGISATVYVLATVFQACAIAGAAFRSREPGATKAWLILAGAVGLAACGHSIWFSLDLRGIPPFPSSADAIYLIVILLLAGALWMFGRDGKTQDGAFNDDLIVIISASAMAWEVVIRPLLKSPGLTATELLLSAAYTTAYLILLPLIVRFIFRFRSGNLAHKFLVFGMLAYIAGDILFAQGRSAGWYAPGGILDGLWLVAYILFAAAAWHPSTASGPHKGGASAGLSDRRAYVLGAAAVIPPALTLAARSLDTETAHVAAAAYCNLHTDPAPYGWIDAENPPANRGAGTAFPDRSIDRGG